MSHLILQVRFIRHVSEYDIPNFSSVVYPSYVVCRLLHKNVNFSNMVYSSCMLCRLLHKNVRFMHYELKQRRLVRHILFYFKVPKFNYHLPLLQLFILTKRYYAQSSEQVHIAPFSFLFSLFNFNSKICDPNLMSGYATLQFTLLDSFNF